MCINAITHSVSNPMRKALSNLWRISLCLCICYVSFHISHIMIITYVSCVHIYIQAHTNTHIHTFVYKVLIVSDIRVFERNEPCRQQGRTRYKVYIAYHNTNRRTGKKRGKEKARLTHKMRQHRWVSFENSLSVSFSFKRKTRKKANQPSYTHMPSHTTTKRRI